MNLISNVKESYLILKLRQLKYECYLRKNDKYYIDALKRYKECKNKKSKLVMYKEKNN